MSRTLAAWAEGELLTRFAAHLLHGELQRLRPRSAVLPAGATVLDLPDLELEILRLDSLDLLQLGVALAAALDLNPEQSAALSPSPRRLAEWIAQCRTMLTGDGGQICFRSSGSTGQPRGYRHALCGLVEEADCIAGLLGPRARVLAAVPAHHIYGFLCSVLLPVALNAGTVIDVPSPQALPALWRAGDVVVGFPDFWQAVVSHGQRPPTGIRGLTATAPCPAATVHALADLGVPVLELFGASETAGLGWRDDPDQPFRWFPWWQAAPGGDLVRRLLDGTQVQVALPDSLDALPPDPFRPLGRRDGVVQVGGVNVLPAAVGRRLCQHPWVAEAAVRLMRPDEGQRLKAFLVPSAGAPDADALIAGLADWIAQQLPPAERPVALRVGPVLPRGQLGKAADWDA